MMAIPHIEMIVAAYAVTAVAIAAMIGYVLVDYRSLKGELAALERKPGDAVAAVADRGGSARRERAE